MSALSTFDSTVNSLYLAFFGRPADPAGLAFWSKQLANNNGDLTTITPFFANSEEAQVRFGTGTVASRIDEIYEQLFNRAPDAAGRAFWTNAVEKGNATLADASIAILKGAQGIDQTLSNLRQQAADAFTAAVDASGSAYNGYASIEAARMLVHTVTLDVTTADLNTLVKAAVSFADTATKTPQVVEAIATGSTLLALFDTTRGAADPVALAQALADTAKAAAGDPVTLASLLRGGGMAQVLKVMPANATLKDVVKALAEGGLPAAVEVVYPTTPATPATNLKLAFASVTQGEGDSRVDNVTREKDVVVKFTYTGDDLRAGQNFEYSLDGVHWSQKYLKVDTSANIVTIGDVGLAGADLQQHGINVMESVPAADLVTTFQLRAVNANGRVLASASQDLVYDRSAPTEALSFVGIAGGVPGDNVTNKPHAGVTFDLDGGQGDGIVQWRLGGDEKWSIVDQKNISGNGAFTLDVDLTSHDQTLEVRVIDAAGNVGDRVAQFIDGPAGHEPTFGIIPSHLGLEVSSDTAGKLSIFNFDNKTSSQLNTTKGTSDIDVGISVIGAQDQVLKGVVQFTVPNGQVSTLLPESIVLGTDKGEGISGSVVWGFGGNDEISGTTRGDYLFGGDGDDIISSGMGADLVFGGRGADLIDLGDDQDPDQLQYAPGDAASGDFIDGSNTAALDKITNFRKGDAIWTNTDFGKAPIVQTTYLNSGSAAASVAVVRGTSVDNTFTAGTGSNDDDYMVQWNDGKTVNSIIVQDYGLTTPHVEVQAFGGKIVFHEPVVSKVTSSYFSLIGAPSLLTLQASPAEIIRAPGADSSNAGLLDRSGLSLVEVREGREWNTSENFLDGEYFDVFDGGAVRFDNTLTTALYKLKWTADTFATSEGSLRAGELLFAGGVTGQVLQEGFAIDEMVMLGSNLSEADGNRTSTAFIYDTFDQRTLFTGGGHDLVIDDGATLDIGYRLFDSTAQDLIFGFDTGNDQISLHDDAARTIDADSNGLIEWASSVSVYEKAVVTETTEAVSIILGGSISTGNSSWEVSNTVNTLNNGIDLRGMKAHGDLLILASSDMKTDGALFHFKDVNGNARVDADELTVFAVFHNNTPVQEDIIVVGMMIP